MSVLLFLSGVLGNAAGLFLYLAPMVMFKRIISRRSTEKFSGIPYVMTFLSCIIYTWYGLPFVSRNNLLISIISEEGEDESYGTPCSYYDSLLGHRLRLPPCVAWQHQEILLRRRCGPFSTITYASPLSVMRMVIKTKSVEFMPFFLSLFTFLSGVSWLAYGLLSGDPFVMVSNGFGTGLGIAQLILYAIYCKNKSHTENAIEDDFTGMDPERLIKRRSQIRTILNYVPEKIIRPLECVITLWQFTMIT
ncbi:Peroxidase [Psidium guajava]|nr:Peroxidase [Psidium guajava]